MFGNLISLQWKSFFRAASLKANLVMKIFMVLIGLYFIAMFSFAGIGLFYGLEKNGYPPLETLNRFIIYYLAGDLVFRYLLQKMPVVNIKPLLLLPFNKKKIVNFALSKTALSYFNYLHAFFFIPFTIILFIEGYDPVGTTCWLVSMTFFLYINNFINIFLNNKLVYVLIAATIIMGLGAAQYYSYFDISPYTGSFFQSFYETYWKVIIPLAVLALMIVLAHRYFLKRLYLDAGLATKASTASTENLDWLNRFGRISTFLKNDIKLIKRNKRSKTTIFLSVAFLFYGLLFFTGGIETYNNPFMKIFAGIFVSGGFLFSFGQFVPSWDSAYYPLMMTQNISYKEYLTSKWYLVVIATALSTILGAGYLYFGWEAYAAVVVGGIYNMGLNAHVVLLGGAYVKTPIDLSSNKKAFGDSSAFNVKTLLITVPKLVLPIAIYALGHFTLGPVFGFALVALSGIAGFALRNTMFKQIEKVYKSEKYKTIAAYKQTS